MERKHRSEMTKSEITFVEKLIHSTREWNFAVDHILQRMEQKGIAKQDLIDTLKFGEVIEVNSKGRVVLRLRMKLNSKMKRGTCAVVSVQDRVLVTAWFNNENDHHATLDKSEYSWTIDIIEYLKEITQ